MIWRSLFTTYTVLDLEMKGTTEHHPTKFFSATSTYVEKNSCLFNIHSRQLDICILGNKSFSNRSNDSFNFYKTLRKIYCLKLHYAEFVSSHSSSLLAPCRHSLHYIKMFTSFPTVSPNNGAFFN